MKLQMLLWMLLHAIRNLLSEMGLEQAKAIANGSKEHQVYAFNARNLVTRWGPNGQIADYSARLWSGLIRSYYRPRWKIAMDAAVLAWRDGSSSLPRDDAFRARLDRFEQDWQLKGFELEPRATSSRRTFKAELVYVYSKYHRLSASVCKKMV